MKTLSTCSDEDIAKALALMRSSLDMEDHAIYSALVREGIESRSAARLVEFLPLVYGRIALASFGIHFSQTFRRCLPEGQMSDPRPFSSEPIWGAADRFARTEIENGLVPEDFFAVAKRSSEFAAINKAIKASDSPEGATSETYFFWPEDGPGDA